MATGVRLAEINQVMLSGRLTRDPEIKFLPSGRALGRLSLASSRRFFNKTSNEWQEETAFVDVSAWGDVVGRIKDRLKKGSPVLVEGRLRFRQWEGQDGAKKSKLEIEARRLQFLELSSTAAASPEYGPSSQGPAVREGSSADTSGRPPSGEGEETALPTFGTSESEETANDLEGVAL